MKLKSLITKYEQQQQELAAINTKIGEIVATVRYEIGSPYAHLNFPEAYKAAQKDKALPGHLFESIREYETLFKTAEGLVGTIKTLKRELDEETETQGMDYAQKVSRREAVIIAEATRALLPFCLNEQEAHQLAKECGKAREIREQAFSWRNAYDLSRAKAVLRLVSA